MHTFNAHAATDITGFGILGHAQNLAKQQRNEVSFVIHNLPVLAKMAAVSKACGNMFGLMHGTCPETSGNLLLCPIFPSAFHNMYPQIDDWMFVEVTLLTHGWYLELVLDRLQSFYMKGFVMFTEPESGGKGLGSEGGLCIQDFSTAGRAQCPP